MTKSVMLFTLSNDFFINCFLKMLEEIVFTLGRIIVNLEGILQLFLQKKIIEAAAAARANKLQNQLQLFDRY